MANGNTMFDASKEWVITLSSDRPDAKKAADDLSRHLGLLAVLSGACVRQSPVLDANSAADFRIALVSEGSNLALNGFWWKAEPELVEIHGESARGLCNGIYSFLAALGISWPAPGQEKLPARQPVKPHLFPLAANRADFAGTAPRRFAPAQNYEIKSIFRCGEAFVEWAARRRCDALIFPLAVFAAIGSARRLKELRKAAAEYGIALEAGGAELSSLVPSRFFLLHSGFFRMEEGIRKKDHHFCPTNPGVIRVIANEAGKLFRAAAGAKVFHLWPDKDAETAWCSCPSCRAFTAQEQIRVSVNAAADILAALNPNASIAFFEGSGEGENIPLRKNVFILEDFPAEKIPAP